MLFILFNEIIFSSLFLRGNKMTSAGLTTQQSPSFFGVFLPGSLTRIPEVYQGDIKRHRNLIILGIALMIISGIGALFSKIFDIITIGCSISALTGGIGFLFINGGILGLLDTLIRIRTEEERLLSQINPI